MDIKEEIEKIKQKHSEMAEINLITLADYANILINLYEENGILIKIIDLMYKSEVK